ncbi:rho guanine nucleotide exchange factor 7b isoform X1 [Tachysurus ichikawai]
MNPAEQTVTWLIALGVLESPKKRISDPESFLQSSLRDGVVLCRLHERLRPGSLLTVNCLKSCLCSKLIKNKYPLEERLSVCDFWIIHALSYCPVRRRVSARRCGQSAGGF